MGNESVITTPYYDEGVAKSLVTPTISGSITGVFEVDLPTKSLISNDFYNNITTIYFDIITDQTLFERAKVYEDMYKKSSVEFYTEWKKGQFPLTPEKSDWAGICRHLGLVYDNNNR